MGAKRLDGVLHLDDALVQLALLLALDLACLGVLERLEREPRRLFALLQRRQLALHLRNLVLELVLLPGAVLDVVAADARADAAFALGLGAVLAELLADGAAAVGAQGLAIRLV